MSYKKLVTSQIKSLRESDKVYSLAKRVVYGIQNNETHFTAISPILFTSLKIETEELAKEIKNAVNKEPEKTKIKNLQSIKVLDLLYLHAKHISKLSKKDPNLIRLSGIANPVEQDE